MMGQGSDRDRGLTADLAWQAVCPGRNVQYKNKVYEGGPGWRKRNRTGKNAQKKPVREAKEIPL